MSPWGKGDRAWWQGRWGQELTGNLKQGASPLPFFKGEEGKLTHLVLRMKPPRALYLALNSIGFWDTVLLCFSSVLTSFISFSAPSSYR